MQAWSQLQAFFVFFPLLWDDIYMKRQRILHLTIFYIIKFVIGLITKHFMVLYYSGILISILILITAHQYNFRIDVFLYLDVFLEIMWFQLPEGSLDENDLYLFVSKSISLYAAIEIILYIMRYQIFGYKPKNKIYQPSILWNLLCVSFIYLAGLIYLFFSDVAGQLEISLVIVFTGFIAYLVHVFIFFMYILFKSIWSHIREENMILYIKI